MRYLLFLFLLPLTLFGQSQKISDMTSATTLAGTEYVPIVQTTNKKATVSLLRGWSSGTANTITYWPTTSTLGSLSLATYPSLTELSYVKGVTSAIQTQLNASVVGPASATDNALVRYDLTTGKLVQNSVLTIGDTGYMELGAGLATSSYNFDITSTGSTADFRIRAKTASNPTQLYVNGSTNSIGITDGTNLVDWVFGSGITEMASGNALHIESQSGNFSLETANADGLKLQSNASGKISFFNATPVVKQSAVTTTQGLTNALVTYGLLPTSTISDVVVDDAVSGTTLTLDDADNGKLIYFTNSSAITVTLPSGLIDGFYVMLVQDNTGAISITTSGTTLNGTTSTSAQYDVLTLTNYKATNTYIGK